MTTNNPPSTDRPRADVSPTVAVLATVVRAGTGVLMLLGTVVMTRLCCAVKMKKEGLIVEASEYTVKTHSDKLLLL